nr:muscarinic acetylcholine receptor M3-like [Lytechinus pictus]
MANFDVQNVSESPLFSTVFFTDYPVSFTNISINPPDVVDSSSTMKNINGILWPILFTAMIIVANSLSLIAFSIEKRLRTYNNYFIINLAILDFFDGLFLIPQVVHTHVGYYPFSHKVCRVMSAVQAGFLTASNLAVVVICADRHRATYDPINHFISRSKRMAVMKNLIPWVVSLGFWLLYITTPEFIINFDNDRHCTHWFRARPFATTVTFIVYFYLPFCLIVVLYIRIVLKIRSSFAGKEVSKQFAMTRRKEGSTPSPRNEMASSSCSTFTTNTNSSSSESPGNELKRKDSNDIPVNSKNNQRETATETSKATKTLLLIVIAFVVSWLPQSIMILVYSVEPVLVIHGLPRSVRLFFGWMTYLNSLLNPISYAVSQPLFKSTIMKMFLLRRK